MSLDIILLGSDGVSMLQTLSSRAQVSPLHHHHAQVVKSLHVVRLRVQDPLVALLGRVQVSDVVDVDVPEEDEGLDVVGVVSEQLMEERCGLQRST